MRPTFPDNIRAFLYARSASEMQNAPREKVDQQLQRLREFAKYRSYTIVGEACDAAQSGNKLSRPGLKTVMSESTRRPSSFDLLLTTDPSRLARDVVLRTAITSRLTDAGITIEYTGDTHLDSSLADHGGENLLKGHEDYPSLTAGGHDEDN